MKEDSPFKIITISVLAFIVVCIFSFNVFAESDCVWEDWIIDKNPTCTSVGHKHRVCIADPNAKHTEEEFIPMIPHEYEITEKEPTCSSKGIHMYVCKNCGYSYIEEFGDYAEHQYNSSVTKNATCIEEGESIYTCDICGKSYKKSIPKIEHNYNETIEKQPDCTSVGIKKYECTICGDSYTEKFGKIKEHSFVEVTEEKNGYKITNMVCEICGYTYESKRENHSLPVEEKNDDNNYIAVANIAVGSLDIIALTVFTVLLVPDCKVLRWHSKKKKAFLLNKFK